LFYSESSAKKREIEKHKRKTQGKEKEALAHLVHFLFGLFLL
jgi:hypothetical protein